MDRPWESLAARTGRVIAEDDWRAALAQHRVVLERWDDLAYYRLEKEFAGLARGTLLLPEGVVHEYGHIPRIFHLERGLRRAFAGPFHIEEKIDGYNVRIARVGERTLAFSRGGFVCPFATDRLPDFPAVERFLAGSGRGAIVCAEIAGPGNPYNIEHPRYITSDIRLFAFDLMELDSGRIVYPGERNRRLADAGIDVPRSYGEATPGEPGRVRDVVRALDAEGGEGVVLKAAAGGGARVKYVTLGADVRDLAAVTGLLGDIPRAFLVNRLVQAAFTLHELEGGALSDEVSRRFGAALLRPLLQSVADVDRPPGAELPSGEVREVFTVRMREERNVERLLRQMDRASASVQVKVLRRERDPSTGRFAITCAKRYQKATGYFLSRLVGHAFVD